jgi:hypothetical protein
VDHIRELRYSDFRSQDLDERLGHRLGISEEERLSIVEAIGGPVGRWFKCPNGHPYVVTECGGATQEGTCPECGAAVGGANHQISVGNTLASEMDGAQAPAYPTALHRN